jgi:hypothetical protein
VRLALITRLLAMARNIDGASAWAVALLLFGAALGLRLALWHWPEVTPYMTFFPTIALATVLCGWRPALLVLVLASISSWFFFLPPAWSFAWPGAHNLVALCGFLLVGAFELVLVATLVEFVRRLEVATRLQDSLFEELQHRIANNLHIIAIMLESTQAAVRGTPAEAMVERAAARVIAMGELSRRLHDRTAYEAGLEPVLRDLTREQFRDMAVDVRLDVSGVALPVDRMMTVVLLVSEAAMNAAKHVFRPRRGSVFEVSLARSANGQALLTIRDDGPGMAQADPAATPQQQRLGMRIMRGFARQLGGSLVVSEGPGTTLMVTFAV